jgi:signal transduction histidine kinase
MHKKKHGYLAAVISLLTFIGLFITIFLLHASENSTGNHKRITDRVQSELRKKERMVSECIEELLKDYVPDSAYPSAVVFKQTGRMYLPEEVAFFILENDSIVWWSDNTTLQPDNLADYPVTNGCPVHLDNGYYEMLVHEKGSLKIAGMILIKHSYAFNNQYLKNTFAAGFSVPVSTDISLSKGNYNICSSEGTFLFSLDFTKDPGNSSRSWLIALLFIAGVISFSIFLYSLYLLAFPHVQGQFLFPVLFSLDLILIRALQFIFRWPSCLYETTLFGPQFYASSDIFPSPGDFLVNSLILLIISWVFYRKFPLYDRASLQKRWKRTLAACVFSLVPLAAFAGVLMAIRDLVMNSNIFLDLQFIAGLSEESFIALLIIAFLGIASFFFVCKGLRQITGIFHGNSNTWFRPGFTVILVYFILLSLVGTIILNRANAKSEKKKRELLAYTFAAKRNPLTEIQLADFVHRVKQDSMLFACMKNPETMLSEMEEDSLEEYIRREYFSEHWSNYNVLATACWPEKQLRIQPQAYIIDCAGYFEDLISSFGTETDVTGVYYLDYGYSNENYIAVISAGSNEPVMYVEINAKYTYKELGYPGLLIDRTAANNSEITSYSYAFYQHGRLVYRVGEYPFGFNLGSYVTDTSSVHFFTYNDMDHLFYPVDETTSLLISRKEGTFLSAISPFSYLLVLFIATVVVFYFFMEPKRLLRLTLNTLRSRLQIFMLGVILLSFIITGIVLLFYLMDLNKEQNEQSLMERSMSILIEVEHKFGLSESLEATGEETVSGVLVKLSNVFFSDINIYNSSGLLFATSRPQVFSEGLLSRRMNRQAYDKLVGDQSSVMVQTERIGRLSFSSAYMPLYNSENNLLGFVNLPYFEQQDDLKREISTFLVAFVNLYILFILLGLFVTYLISNYITAPLKLLAEHLGRIQIGRINEKIIWKKDDEIGRLVDEYNRMLDELLKSAKIIAESERESAWREMARQVAHEIKNPLTPIKLSVQHLQKSWEDGSPDWDQRLKRFSAALIEQIDTLSAIASEFSYFAKMPEPDNEVLELDTLIRSAVSLYHNDIDISIETNLSSERKEIWGDLKQINRMFSNILNNAVQAIEPGKKGIIHISSGIRNNMYQVKISDNGGGMTAAETAQIFTPNFTTKSGGSGLGLAIVKGIITSMQGDIAFESEKGKGTTCIIYLPGYKHAKPEKESLK